MSIHPTAIIEKGAQIGQAVTIGPYCYVGPHVVIGDNCTIHHHATIEGCTSLGQGCEVFPQALLGTRPQDMKYNGEHTTLEIGSDNIFRELVTVHPGTANGGGVTRIGNNNLFLVGVHVAHDCHVGSRCVLANYTQLAGHVHVENHVNMGGHSAVHHFVTIGKHAFIGGMTRIPADVPPFMVIVAARGTRTEVRMVNGVGLQRNGYSGEDITALKTAYMRIFSRRVRMNGTAIRDRVEAILQDSDLNTQVEYLCRFLLRSFAHGRHGRYLESLRQDPVHRSSWKLDDNSNVKIDVVGRGSVTQASESNKDGAIILLTATADPGWSFAGWNGSLSGTGNPMRVSAGDKHNVTATFQPNPTS